MESKDASVSSVFFGLHKRRLSSVEEVFSVFSVGIRKPLVDLVTLRAVYLDARYVRPFCSPATGLLVFFIKLRLSHLRGQRLLNYSVRTNSLLDRCSRLSPPKRTRTLFFGGFGTNRNFQKRVFGRSHSEILIRARVKPE